MTTLLSRAALAAAAMALGLSGAQATTANGTLSVRLTVTSGCQVGSPTLDFGNQSGLTNGTVSAIGTIVVTCTDGTSYDVTLDNGANYSGNTRNMASSGKLIPYALYSDAGMTTPWIGTASIHGTGRANTPQSVSVYGQATLSGSASGAYVDTVSITVTY
jgi:spore coat protein U-like protein